MNTEDMLSELFAAEADRRPEAVGVLDAVHERIARRRRVAVTRSVGALGAAAAVVAIAVGVSAATEPSGHGAGPVGDAPASTATTGVPTTATPTAVRPSTPVTHAPSSSPTPPPPSRTSGPSIVRPTGTRTYSTINAGYLPGPATQDPAGTSNQPGFEERDWDVTVDGVAMDVIIWVESGSLPSRMQATGGKHDYRSITINGHPGREFVSDNVTIVAFDLGNGTVAYSGPSVARTTAAVDRARISAIAVKVAQNMQFNRHDPIPGS